MTQDAPQRLLIIDDHPLFRRGLAQLLSEEPEFDVVGEASGGREGIEMVERLEPDMILLDLNMKDMNGIEVLKALKAGGNEAKIVMLTVSDQPDHLIIALREGADGYLLKELEPEALLEKLKQAADGQVILSDGLASQLAYSLRRDTGPRDPDEAGLTDQERRILELIASGMSNKAIARQLDISDGTVKVHVKHLLKKLNLRSRLEAAVWAIEHRR